MVKHALVRVQHSPPCEGSSVVEHQIENLGVEGSTPSLHTIRRLAQLVEHSTDNGVVLGSSPRFTTITGS